MTHGHVDLRIGVAGRTRSGPSAFPDGVNPPRYSMRMPVIARLMTSRWISEVPSKIV